MPAKYSVAQIVAKRRQLGGGPSLAYFVDGVSGGDGSRSSPFTNFATLNTMAAGDLDNYSILVKSGSTIRAPLALLNGHENLTVDLYGGTTKPLIDLTQQVTGAWTNAGTDLWYQGSWAHGDCAMYHAGFPCERRDALDKMDAAHTYPCVETGLNGNWPYLFFYDSGTSRMYVYLGDGLSTTPSSSNMRRGALQGVETTFGNAITAGTCPSLAIRSMRALGAWANVVSISECVGLLLEDVESYGAGGTATSGSYPFACDLFSIQGVSAVTPTTDTTLRRCKGVRSGIGIGHAFEYSWLNGVTMDDCEASNIPFHALELWNSCQNVAVRRMKVKSTMSVLMLAGPESDTVHSNISFTNCEVIQRRTFVVPASGGQGITTSGTGYKNYSDVSFLNNTFDMDNYRVISETKSAPAGTGNLSLTFQNNMVRQSQLAGSTDDFLLYDTMAAFHTFGHNVYHIMGSYLYPFSDGTYFGAFAGWAAAVTSDATSTAPAAAVQQQVNAGVVTYGLQHLELVGTDAAGYNAATSGGPSTDILGTDRGASPDIGAYEFVPYPSFSLTAKTAQLPATYIDCATVHTVTGVPARRVSVTGNSGRYRINGGSWVTTAGYAVAGDTVEAQVLTGSVSLTDYATTLTIGSTAASFTATTGLVYSQTLSGSASVNEQGCEVIGTGWVTSTDRIKTVSSDPRGAGSMVTTLAFSSVPIPKNATILSVTLTCSRATGNAGFHVRVYGESNANNATTSGWGAAKYPSQLFATPTDITTNYGTFTTVAPGAMTCSDLLATIQEIVSSTNWATGNAMNLWFESSDTAAAVFSFQATSTTITIAYS